MPNSEDNPSIVITGVPHTDLPKFSMKRGNSGFILWLVLMVCVLSGSFRLYAINAAPAAANFPKGILSLPDLTLVEKADAFNKANHPDSALLYYMIVAQRDLDTRSPQSIRLGIQARIKAGSLYYTPFYDYGKAYALFQEAYDLAIKHSQYEMMGMAANNIGNVLSVYSITQDDNSGSNIGEIVDWYSRSVDHYMQGKIGKYAIPTLNNLMSMAMDTALLRRITPLLVEFYRQEIPDTVLGQLYTKRRIEGYLRIREGRFGDAASIFRSILSDSLSNAQSPHDEIMVDFDLAGLYMLQDYPDSAMVFAKRVENLAMRNEMVEVIPGAILMEADLYDIKGDSVKRDATLLRYYVAKDSLLKISSIYSYIEPHLRKRIADIDVQLIQVKGERRQAGIIIWALIGLMVVIAGFTLMLVRKNRALDSKNRHLVGQMKVIDRQEKLLLKKALGESKEISEAQERTGECGTNQENDTVKNGDANPELLARIISVMESDPSIFNPDFSIDMLAHLCGEKTKAVSVTLNAALDKNFNTLLNEYRVREMCRLLDEPNASSLTIEGVAQQAGYRSRSTYIAAFKRLTGLTPSEYVKVKNRMAKELS